ncbi:hypothetical protein DBR32_04905 [Taibaiella sp. KBW10]|nr:hypothetical protein DBR32_04905 [Taibaiella sp. KBW10]
MTAQIGFEYIDTVIGKDILQRDSIYIRTGDTTLNYPSMLSVNEDSVIKFLGGFKATQMAVMFNPEKPVITYRFQPDSTVNQYDTIRLYYKPSYHFISNACGYTYYYKLDSVRTTKHLLDSAFVNVADVTQSAQDKHVKLYFID